MQPTFRNRTALFARAFTLVWLVGLVVFAWVFVRDADTLPPGQRQLGAVFLPVAAILGAWVGWLTWVKTPLVQLEVPGPGRVRVVRGTLGRRAVAEYIVRDEAQIALRTGTDSEDDPYHRAVLVPPGGSSRDEIVSAESHDRARIQQSVDQLRGMVLPRK